ncbi:MAG: DNA-directed RNA polymerase subunit omega, partial [bacterium]
EFEKYAENIYEAIFILAKRARQINDEQKRFFLQDIEYDEDFDEYEEEETERAVKDVKQASLPKPTTIALEEFLCGKIQYDYHEASEEEAGPA